MKRRYLGNYHNFKCIASKCPATCCSGWAIEVDEESLERYADYQGNDKSFLMRHIDWQEGIFMQQPNGDCGFLQEDGLCRMYITMGEHHLCNTCTLYPRHMEEFPNVREYSLSVSCPVVARELLLQKEALSCIEEQDDQVEELYEEFNGALYQVLFKSREIIITILQNRTLPFTTRAGMVLTMMRDLQDTWDEGDTVDLSLYGNANMQHADYPYVPKDLFLLLYELEPLRSEFRTFTEEAEAILFHDENALASLEEAFNSTHPDWEIFCEHIAVYFIFTYLCGAVYDDYIYAMACQGIYNSYMIKLLWMASWNYRTAPLTIDELSQILYDYSRELEHSNDNMILLEELLDQC